MQLVCDLDLSNGEMQRVMNVTYGKSGNRLYGLGCGTWDGMAGEAGVRRINVVGPRHSTFRTNHNTTLAESQY
jgi:hypothetical protein